MISWIASTIFGVHYPVRNFRFCQTVLGRRLREMRHEGRLFSGNPSDWRALMLLDGLMWQHTRRMARLEIREARLALNMSRLELVDYINADLKAKAEAEGLSFPCKQYRQLHHDNFMKKSPKVLGVTAPKFLGDDIFTSGQRHKLLPTLVSFVSGIPHPWRQDHVKA